MTDSSDYRLYLETEFKGVHNEMATHFTAVNGQLREVNKHLATLNGKVAKHEKLISQICASKEWEENAEEKKRIAAELAATTKRDIRFVVFSVITSICALFGIFWMIYRSGDMQSNVKEIKSETKVTNDILYEEKLRGQQYTPPAFRNDTLK